MVLQAFQRSELLKYNTIHSTSLPVVQNNYKGFLTIMIKKALDQKPFYLQSRLPAPIGVYTLMFCTTGIEIQIKLFEVRGKKCAETKEYSGEKSQESGITSLLQTQHWIPAL